MKTKLLRKYSEAHLAHIHKAKLEEEGISAFVFGENTIGTAPFFSGLMGAGIELRVKEEDYEEALKFIEPESGAPKVCPNCNSSDIKFAYDKKSFAQTAFSLLSALIGEPFGNIKRHYFCGKCGFKIRD